MAAFKILSLDGGGSWALIQIKALIDLYGENTTGHQVLNKFDLVSANSGGALSLAGLTMDWPLLQVLDMFKNKDKRDSIFVRAGIFQDFFAHFTGLAGIGPRYVAKDKYTGLRALLVGTGDLAMSALPAAITPRPGNKPVHFVICGFDYDRNREVFFRSDTGSLAGSLTPSVPPGEQAPKEATLAQAAHASSNAPVNYFDEPAMGPNQTRYWDGAIGGYNNPVLAGVIEAVANAARYDTDRHSISVLSIGTANKVLPLPTDNHKEDSDLVAPHDHSDIPTDILKLAKSILGDPPDAATFHAHVMLDCPLPGPNDQLPISSRIVRLNPLIQPVRDANNQWIFPGGMDRTAFKFIRDMDMDATKPEEVTAIEAFCELWLAGRIPNQSIRSGGPNFTPEIGFDRYPPAKAVAQLLFP